MLPSSLSCMCVHALYQVSSLYSHTYKVLQKKKNNPQYMYMVSFSFSIKFISFFNRWFLYNVFLYGCLEYKLLYAWMSGMNNCIEIYYSICYNFIIFFCSSVLLDLKDFFNVLHQQPSSKALLYMYLVQG